jgi:acyl carrier protein
MAARDGRTADRLARIGLRPLPMATVFEILEEALAENWGCFDAAEIEWSLWARQAADGERTRLSEVLPAGQAIAGGTKEAFRSGILGLAAKERRAAIFELTVEIVATVLKIPKSRIAPSSSLRDLGADSLMAAEISNGVFDRTGVRLRILYLARGPTLADMAERVEEGILATGVTNKSPIGEPLTWHGPER